MKNETGSANSVFPHRRKTVGTKVHAFASPLINVGKCRIFLNKKGKNHLIINILSGRRGEVASCPNFFVWDCLKEEFIECHTTRC